MPTSSDEAAQNHEKSPDPRPNDPNCWPSWNADIEPVLAVFRVVVYIQYVTEPGNCFGQLNPFFLARRRPTVDHSLVAGGPQRQGLQTGRPDAHQTQCLFSPCSP